MDRAFLIGEYLPADSILHRLDPRTKVTGLLLMLAVIFGTWSWLGTVFNLLAVSVVAATSRAGLRIWFQGLMGFRWMLVAVLVLNLVARQYGRPVMVAGHEIPITWDGIETGVVFTAQIVLAIVLSMSLAFTTSVSALIKAGNWFGKPLRRLGLPVEEWTLALMLALRFVPMVQLELQTIIDGQKSRGVAFHSGGLLARAQNIIAVLVPALTRVLERADLLATAMAARGFRIGGPRSTYKPLALSRADRWAFLALGLFLACRATLLP